ncbi:cation:proton antiporter [Desulfofalx alkaliphila]|uniref:cation:proton antiporter n=1 Tax=Desulfofalx alkaliphila TaxID=105483 RepID=UPI001EE40EE7
MNYISQKLRFPSLLAYMFLGIGLVHFLFEKEIFALEHVANIGIVLLSFSLGLQFPLNRLLNISRRIWRVGILDIVLNFGVSFVLAYIFGLNLMAALIIGGVAYGTSSSITVKVTEETKRSNTPESEFGLALLVFEDLSSQILVSVLTGLIIYESITGTLLLGILLKVALLSAAAILIAHYVFKRLDLFLQHYMSTDFIPLFAVSVAFICSGVAIYLGLSQLLGAFLAGVMLSETGTSKQLQKIVVPMKDLSLPFFFFWFGTTISFGQGGVPLALLTLLIIWGLVGKFLVGYYGGKMYGLSSKGAIRCGFSFFQRGEFSVIIAALAEPALRASAGIYIITTSLIGVYLFKNAPKIANLLYKSRKQK